LLEETRLSAMFLANTRNVSDRQEN